VVGPFGVGSRRHFYGSGVTGKIVGRPISVYLTQGVFTHEMNGAYQDSSFNSVSGQELRPTARAKSDQILELDRTGLSREGRDPTGLGVASVYRVVERRGWRRKMQGSQSRDGEGHLSTGNPPPVSSVELESPRISPGQSGKEFFPRDPNDAGAIHTDLEQSQGSSAFPFS